MIDALNPTSRYTDDLLNIINIHFEQMVERIYLPLNLNLTKLMLSLFSLKLFILIQFLQKYMINGISLILILLISH